MGGEGRPGSDFLHLDLGLGVLVRGWGNHAFWPRDEHLTCEVFCTRNQQRRLELPNTWQVPHLEAAVVLQVLQRNLDLCVLGI